MEKQLMKKQIKRKPKLENMEEKLRKVAAGKYALILRKEKVKK